MAMNRKQRRRAARKDPSLLAEGMLADARTHLAAGETKKARAVLQKLTKSQPDNTDALHLLGLVLVQMGKAQLAADAIRQALRVNPGNFAAHDHLGLALQAADRSGDALDSFDQAIRLRPDYAPAHNNRGNTLKGLNRLEDALESFDRALQIEPELADALVNRGITLRDMARYDEALDCYGRALTLRPDDAEAHYNRGNVLKDMGRFDEALIAFDEAIGLQPAFPDAYSNRGNTLKELARHDEALASYEHALALRPDFPECRLNLAFLCLLLGRFTRGWEEYGARAYLRKPKMSDVRKLDRTLLPMDLAGQHIVVVKEQGLGDELFFLRFAPMLRHRGAYVSYVADRRLVAMLARAGIVDRVLAEDEEPGPSDLRLSVGDLPWLLGVGDAPPPPFPLPPRKDRTAALNEQLAAFGPPPYVGLTWRAGTNEPGTIFKEFPFDKLADALGQDGGSLVAVQRQPEPGEVAALEDVFGRPVLDFTALNDDLEDMLALMDLLDTYFCVSNTNLHLRVANGRPSHVLIPLPYDFRWIDKGPESPWFPNTAVYRQNAGGDWSAAFERLERDIRSQR